MRLQTLALMTMSAILIIQAPSTRADEAPAPRDLVARYYAQFQKPGFLVDELLEFYADDVRFTDPTFEIVAKGKSEVRRLYADLGTERTAYKNIRWQISDVVADGSRVVIRGQWSGTFHGCKFSIDFMTLWRLEDGKIAEQNDFFAASAFDRQVGWNGETATCDSR